MKKFFNEFKTFALKGNVMDMAVGVIIGAAFQGIVTSLIENVINPIIGIAFQIDFSNVVVTLGKVDLKIGAFIASIINFILMAFVLFLLVKFINSLKSKKEEKPAAPAKSPELLELEKITKLLSEK